MNIASQMRRYTGEKYSCPQTDIEYLIWRPKSKKREKFHRKTLYCPLCDEYHNFVKE